MSTLQIEERIVINAPVERVWQFLLDPEQVVQCLPGATYDGAESEHVFLGHMKVKVGPVTTLFAGKATMSEIDAGARSIKILGEGKDKNGAGTAKLTMHGSVVAVDGGSELRVVADVDIAGKLVTFGRGLIKAVSAQLFKQFSARAQALLEPEAGAADAAAPAAEPAAEAACASPCRAPCSAETARPRPRARSSSRPSSASRRRRARGRSRRPTRSRRRCARARGARLRGAVLALRRASSARHP